MPEKDIPLTINAAGRSVPESVNGKPQIPFRGVGLHIPVGNKAAPPLRSCADYPADGDKRLPDLIAALEACGLEDNMTISTHHHLRDGDTIALSVFEAASKIGKKDLLWFPSAAFPCHAPLIEHLDSGLIHHIEGSLNGPLGQFCSTGRMRGTHVLRSHGGRWQAVQDGEVHIDIAVVSAPAADCFGNANGLDGPSATGGLGFGLVDSKYADRVIVVTDNLVPFPAVPWQIQGNDVDFVVEVESLGDASRIVSGTTRITRSPDRQLIAEMTARFVEEAGIMRDGFSFQAGAGGTALAFAIFLKDRMERAGVRASFIRGGTTRQLVEMLEEGLTDYLLDGQTFDLDAVESMGRNTNHVMTSPFTSYNYHGKGNFASMVDVVVLGATEVDINFNANVVTHSDGKLMHGIGGWQNCLFAGCTILPVPAMRDRIPVIVDEVTTLCGPGELIDVIVTERGIAINPLRKDLLDRTNDSGLPIKPIQKIKDELDAICGVPLKPQLGDEIVSVVKWVDGTLLDSIRRTG